MSDSNHKKGDSFEEEFDEHLYDEAEFERDGWNEIFSDPETFSQAIEVLGRVIPGGFKKRVSESVGQMSFDDERVRELLSQSNVPKDVVKFVYSQINATKREITRIVAKEIREFLEDTDLAGEVARILTRLSFEVTMEVRFVPNDDALKPNVKGKVRAKRSRKDDEEDQP